MALYVSKISCKPRWAKEAETFQDNATFLLQNIDSWYPNLKDIFAVPLHLSQSWRGNYGWSTLYSSRSLERVTASYQGSKASVWRATSPMEQKFRRVMLEFLSFLLLLLFFFFLERNYNTALLFIITVCWTFSYLLSRVPRSLSEFSFPVVKSVLRTCPRTAPKAPITTVTTSTFRIAQTVVNIYLTL